LGLQILVRYSRVYILSESVMTKFYCTLSLTANNEKVVHDEKIQQKSYRQ